MIIFLRQCTNRKMWLGGLLCSILGTRLCAYNQKTLFITLYVGYCVQLGRFCPQEQHRVTQQLGKLYQSNTGLPRKQFQQVCHVHIMKQAHTIKCCVKKMLGTHFKHNCLWQNAPITVHYRQIQPRWNFSDTDRRTELGLHALICTLIAMWN